MLRVDHARSLREQARARRRYIIAEVLSFLLVIALVVVGMYGLVVYSSR